MEELKHNPLKCFQTKNGASVVQKKLSSQLMVIKIRVFKTVECYQGQKKLMIFCV